MKRNKVIQFQNGQEFDRFKVNEHPIETGNLDNIVLRPTVTVQLFTNELLPVGYLILDTETASELGLKLTQAAVAAERGQSDEQ